MLLSSVRRFLPVVHHSAVAKTGSLHGLRWFSSDQETHDDFKPQFKGETTSSVVEQIEEDIKSHQVFVYMKGHPTAPMCGFSNQACRILDFYGVEYGSRNVLADPDLRDGIKKYTAWPTIPQIFIKGEFQGGADILMQMHQSGELKQLLHGDEDNK